MREREHEDAVVVQLATRIPKRLHQAMKVHCVRTEQGIGDFVAAAVREKLRRGGGRRG